jgi:sulfide:quinone oxidoreductase
MIEIKTLSPEMGVSGQIAVDDLPTIAAAGYRSILCNRPDREEPDQPSFDKIEQAALACGLEARHLPVVSGRVTPADGLAFAQLLEVLPGPVLAYCRSGARSTTLWNLAQSTAAGD